MSFLSKIFNRGSKDRKQPEKEPAKEAPKPRTRQDMEDKLSVQYLDYLQVCTVRKQRSATAEEKKLLHEMLDVIASVPEGRKILEQTVKSGYSFTFETFSGKTDGCMFADEKKITLNLRGHSSVAGLATSAFHEMVHVVQNERSNGMHGINCAKLNMADQFKFWRASEAAACTEASKFTYQIKDKYPEAEKQMERYPFYKTFVEEMEKSGDMTKAGNAAFKSWYGFKYYQTAYEKNHIANSTYFLKCSYRKGDKNVLKASLSSEEILKDVFVSDDIRQSISAEYLTSKEAFSISKEGMEKIDAAVKQYGVKGNVNDRTIHEMYSYETGEKYASAENPKVAAAALVRPEKIDKKRMAVLQAKRQMVQR